MDLPGSSSRKNSGEQTQEVKRKASSSSNRSDKPIPESEGRSGATSPSKDDQEEPPKSVSRQSAHEPCNRVNLLDPDSLRVTKNLYQVAKKEMAKIDIRLPTTSEQYYDLEEILMNPARMEGRELTLNAYDAVRAKYTVFPDNKIAEADMQKVIGSFSCDVCQELIQGSIMTKKCGHRFCDQCILVALMRSGNTCPTCRQNLGSKRELQQDPRFDQLIYQVVESRSIVHRMLASNREHERDVYFGRQGYIEGADKNKFNTDEDDWRKKKLPTEKESSKSKIRWFHEDNDDGTVPSSLHTNDIKKSATKKKLSKQKKRATTVVIDDDDGGTAELVAFTSDPTKPGTASEDTPDQVHEKTPTAEEVTEPVEKNGNMTDECAAELTTSDSHDKNKAVADDKSGDAEEEVICAVKPSTTEALKKDAVVLASKHVPAKEKKTVEHEDDIRSSSESEMSDSSIGDEAEEEEQEAESDDESNDERNTSAESDSDDTSGKGTETKGWKVKSGKKVSGVDKKGKSSESGDGEESDGGSEKERKVKYKKKKTDQNFTEDSDESSSSSENEQIVKPVEAVEEKRPIVQKKKKKQMGRPKKRGKAGLEKEELSDIPTPSEDSLTSSSDGSDDSVDPYSFVFKDAFNRDPRRDGHPEKDKLYNFDFMIDMDTDMVRKHEEDGVPRVISDDSNSESDSEDSDSDESHSVTFAPKHQEQIKQFIGEQERSQSIERVETGEDTQVISVLGKDKVIEEQSAEADKKADISESVAPMETEDTAEVATSTEQQESADEGGADEVEAMEEDEVEEDEDEDVSPTLAMDDRTIEFLTGNEKDRMYQGFLFRKGDTGPDRPRVERAKFLTNGPLNICPQNVIVLYKNHGLHELPVSSKALRIPPEKPKVTEVIDISDDEAKSASKEGSPDIECIGEVPPEVQCLEELSTFASKTAERSTSPESSEDSFEEDEVEFDELLNRKLSRKDFRSNKTNLLCNRVFYETFNPARPVIKDKDLLEEAAQLTDDQITQLQSKQTAFEEGKSHRRRAAISNAVDAAAKSLHIKLNSSDEEEEESETVGKTSTINEKEAKSISSGRRSRSPSVQLVQMPEIGETPIEDMFFDPNEPCSSAQADQRAALMERVEREQQFIEATIQKKAKLTATKSAESRTGTDDLGNDEHQLSGTEETINEGTKIIEIKKTVKVQKKKKVKDNNDDIDFDSRFGEFLAGVDSKNMQRTITDYVTHEFVKVVARPPPNTNDEALFLRFCSRDTGKEFETIKRTGKPPIRNTDEEKLQNLVSQFNKDFNAQNKPLPRTRPIVNIERMFIEKAHAAKYKALAKLEPLHMEILLALQKQQLTAARANTSNPYPVTPEEHTEQVKLLLNLQNETILKQLLVNPQFASTLYQAQLQAVQQKEAAQRAHQKALQEREMAARRAEQMRVEELARKRIAQEDAERAAREAAQRPAPAPAVVAQEEVAKANEAAAVPVSGDSGGRVETLVETVPTQAMIAPSEVDSAAAANVPEATTADTPEEGNPSALSVAAEPQKPSSALSTKSALRTTRSMSVNEETPRLPRARFGSDSSIVKRGRDLWKQERQSNPSRSRSPISRTAIAEQDESADDSTVLAGNITQVVDTTIPDDDNVFGANLDETAGVDMEEMDVDGDLMITHYSEKSIDLNDTQKTFLSAYSDYQKTIANMREDETNREILEYASRYHANVMFPNGKPPPKQLRKKVETVELDDEEQDGDDGEGTSEPKQVEEEVVTLEEEDEDPTVEEIEAVINKEEEEIRQKTEQLEMAKKFLRQRQGLESDSESETESDNEVKEADSDDDGEGVPKQKAPRTRTKAFVPNIPSKIRRKYVERKHELERTKFRNRIKTQKMSNIRIAVQARPQFVAPQPPTRAPKHTTPRAPKQSKKAKMANVNTPTRITAVPNVAAGYHHQQQMYSDMTQVPQSTPVRANSVMPQRGPTPMSQTPSHLAQLGQFVHGNQQQGQQLNQSQIAHIKMMQAAQAAQTAQAAQAAQLGGPPANPQTQMQGPGQHPYGQPMPQQNPQQGNQAAQDEKRKMEEMNQIYHLMHSRGQFPPTNQEAFHVHFAQAQADLRNAQVQSQMANAMAMKAQAEALARQKQAQEQARAQAAAKEAARRKAEAEAAARAKKEAEAKAKAEQERARQAQAHAKLLEVQARAAMEAKQKAAVQQMQGLPPGVTLQQMQQFQQMQFQQAQQYQQLQQMQQMQQMQLQQSFAARMQQGTPKPAGMQGGPQMPNMPPPGMQGFPGMQGMPGLGGMPGGSMIPGMPGMPMIPGMQNFPGLGVNPMQGQMPAMPPPATPAPGGAPAASGMPPNQQQQLLAYLQLQQQLQQHLGQQMPNPYAQQVPNPYAQPAPQAQAAPQAPVQVPVVQQPVPAQTPQIVPPAVPAVPQAVVDPRAHLPPPTPQPVVQAAGGEMIEPLRAASAVPERTNGDVELEIWPTNGYAEKKRQQGSAANPAMYLASRGDSTFYHVASLVRSRSTCNASDIGSVWVLRVEDQNVKQFQLNQTLAEAQAFVGKQHLIIFYDDVSAAEVPLSKEYIVNKDFKPNATVNTH